jgi:integrase
VPLQCTPNPKTGIFYVHGSVVVWRGGKPHNIEIRRSTRTRDAKQAESIKRQIENEVAEQNHTGREPSIPFEIAAHLYAQGGGEVRFLAKPIAHLGGFPIDKIGQREIDEAALKAYPSAQPATIRRQFFTPVLSVLASQGVKPVVSRPAGGGRRTFFFRPEQADDLIASVLAGRYRSLWGACLVTFLFGQGVRISEAMALDAYQDVSLEGRYAVIRDPKNDDQRTVTLIPRVVASLSQLPNIGERGPLFRRYDGKPYIDRTGENRGNPLSFWAHHVAKIGLDANQYTPHTARHSWATWFYAQTKDVMRLKDEGGWNSEEWQRYVKLAQPGLGDAARKRGWRFDVSENKGRSKLARILR